jgi:hypothetical protein
MRTIFKFLIIFSVFVSSVSVANAVPDEMPVPVFVQAKWMQKIFEYVKSLNGKTIRVAIVHGDEFDEAADFVSALKANHMEAFATRNSSAISDANVIYIAPGAKFLDAAKTATRLGALTVTGIQRVFDSGNASIGILPNGERVGVMFNSDQIKLERVEISPDLMRVAKKR